MQYFPVDIECLEVLGAFEVHTGYFRFMNGFTCEKFKIDLIVVEIVSFYFATVLHRGTADSNSGSAIIIPFSAAKSVCAIWSANLCLIGQCAKHLHFRHRHRPKNRSYACCSKQTNRDSLKYFHQAVCAQGRVQGHKISRVMTYLPLGGGKCHRPARGKQGRLCSNNEACAAPFFF